MSDPEEAGFKQMKMSRISKEVHKRATDRIQVLVREKQTLEKKVVELEGLLKYTRVRMKKKGMATNEIDQVLNQRTNE